MFFTDLGGTLRRHADYRWTSAQRALRMLRRRDPLLVIVTSQTRSEVFPVLRARGRHVRTVGAGTVPSQVCLAKRVGRRLILRSATV